VLPRQPFVQPRADRRKFPRQATFPKGRRRAREVDVFITPPPLSAGRRDRGPSARERLRRASEDLHPSSEWRGAVLAAIRAVDDAGPGRIRALYWLHDALSARLPGDPARDTLEQRVLRRAVEAIEEEVVADHASTLRIA
jgi:hypothetical protein